MQAIGDRLREARMRQGVDLTEVEVATKIRAKYLRAMENDEFAMLPGSTYVKSFLRTYAEYLGLDAQLLVEEFRAQHEPRGEGELPSFGPTARARPGRERRGGGMAIGPGVLAVGFVLFVLVLLAVIGLVSGSDEGGGEKKKDRTAAARKAKRRAKEHTPAAPPPEPRSVKLKVIPTETTYVCVDDGKGRTLFEGTISDSQTFRGKRLRINLGRTTASLYVNGERIRYDSGPEAVGFSFSRSGHVTPLAAGDRPCA